MESKNDTKRRRRREIQEIQLALKDLMATRALTLADLAEHLAVSSATAKRLLNQDDLSMERILALCDWLGIEFYELMQVIQTKRVGYHFATVEQEAFLATSLDHFALLRFLQKRQSLAELKEQFGLTDADIDSYLRDLEQQGFLKRLPGGDVRLLVGDGMDWRVDGPLWKAFMGRWIRSIVDDFVKKPRHDDGISFVDVTHRRLTRATYEMLQKELDDISRKYKALSQLEERTRPAEEMGTYHSLMLMEAWSPSFWQIGPYERRRK